MNRMKHNTVSFFTRYCSDVEELQSTSWQSADRQEVDSLDAPLLWCFHCHRCLGWAQDWHRWLLNPKSWCLHKHGEHAFTGLVTSCYRHQPSNTPNCSNFVGPSSKPQHQRNGIAASVAGGVWSLTFYVLLIPYDSTKSPHLWICFPSEMRFDSTVEPKRSQKDVDWKQLQPCIFRREPLASGDGGSTKSKCTTSSNPKRFLGRLSWWSKMHQNL